MDLKVFTSRSFLQSLMKIRLYQAREADSSVESTDSLPLKLNHLLPVGSDFDETLQKSSG